MAPCLPAQPCQHPAGALWSRRWPPPGCTDPCCSPALPQLPPPPWLHQNLPHSQHGPGVVALKPGTVVGAVAGAPSAHTEAAAVGKLGGKTSVKRGTTWKPNWLHQRGTAAPSGACGAVSGEIFFFLQLFPARSRREAACRTPENETWPSAPCTFTASPRSIPEPAFTGLDAAHTWHRWQKRLWWAHGWGHGGAPPPIHTPWGRQRQAAGSGADPSLGTWMAINALPQSLTDGCWQGRL